MNRALALGLTLIGPGLAFAAEPPPWAPAATVWTSAGNPIAPVAAQTPDVPTVPAPSTPSPAAPTPRPIPAPAPTPAAPSPAPLAAPAPAIMPPLTSGTGSAALMPLPNLLNGMTLTTPTVPAGMLPTTPTIPLPATGCESPGGSGPTVRAGRPPFGAGLGPCVDRFKRWLAFQPGPPVLPTCIPEPYHPPVRTFFPCKPTAGGQPGCGPGAVGLGTDGGVAGGPTPTLADRFGMGTGGGCGPDGCPAPKHKGFGACARPSEVAATTGELAVGVAPVGVPLPAGVVGSSVGCDTAGAGCGRGPRLLHGLGGHRDAGGFAAGAAPVSGVPVIMGYTRPTGGGYRYADPLGVPGAGGQPASPQGGAMPTAPGVAPVQHTTPAANRPFTNP